MRLLMAFTAASISCQPIRRPRSHCGRKSFGRARWPFLPRAALATTEARIDISRSSRAAPSGPVICSYAIHSVSSAEDTDASMSATLR